MSKHKHLYENVLESEEREAFRQLFADNVGSIETYSFRVLDRYGPAEEYKEKALERMDELLSVMDDETDYVGSVSNLDVPHETYEIYVDAKDVDAPHAVTAVYEPVENRKAATI